MSKDQPETSTIIVYIRCTSKALREFERFCRHYDVAVSVAGSGEAPIIGLVIRAKLGECQEDAWECVGPPEAIERLTRNLCVIRWHPLLKAARVRVQGQTKKPGSHSERKHK